MKNKLLGYRLIALTCVASVSKLSKAALAAVLLGFMAAINVQASTLTLCTNNFDSYPGAVSSFLSTTVSIPNTDYFRVEDGLAQGDAPSGLGFNGVQLINWDSAPGSAPNSILLRPNTAFRLNLDPRGGTNYTWDFWMKSVKSGAADRGFRLSLAEAGADQNEQDFLVFRSGQASTTNNAGQPGGINVDGVDIIQAFNGFSAASGFPNPNQWVTITNTATGLASYVTNNVWYHYRIVADAVARTFKFYVDDMVTPVNAVCYLSRPQNLPVTTIRFANEGNSADDGYTLIDNVSLTVDGNFIDLASGTYTDGFEGYTASTSATVGTADNNPGGAWVTAETTGVANNNYFAPTKVQVVDSTVTAPHSGNNCLMVSQGQTAGSTISWGQATNEDVKITWWAKVPAAPMNDAIFSVYLRVSAYAWEADYSSASDTILFGYGHRGAAPFGSQPTSILTFSRWFNEWFNNGSWGDTLQTYTADTWEEYQLTTDVKRNSYDLIKNPSSTPVTIVKDGQYISSWGNNKKFHTIAFSTSNNSTPGGNLPAYIDDVTIQPYTNTKDAEPRPYTILGTGLGARFTNYTVLKVPGKTVGGVAMDPRDTNTIVFTIDEERIGAIMKATKVASGNWVIDPTPVVSGLYNPNSLVVETNGTIWFVRDAVKGGQSCGLNRLKAPWSANTVEEIVTDFGSSPTNRSDQPCDLAFFSVAGVTKLAVLDRGVDLNNNPNAIWIVDPATAVTNQAIFNQGGVNQLVAPNNTLFGAGLGGNANGIAALPASGELVTIWEGDGTTDNGVIEAFDTTTGTPRDIFIGPGSGVTWGAGIDVDPTTGRIWVSDRKRTTFPLSAFAVPQIASFNPTSGAYQQELTFTNVNATADRPDRNVNFKDPGMRFSQDGKFLVVSDQGLFSGGGRLLIFHSEPFTILPITITSVTRTSGSVNLVWSSGGGVNYVVQRCATVNGTYVTISGTLTDTQYTDTSSPAGTAFYRVLASAQN
jgi:hypothetical protein